MITVLVVLHSHDTIVVLVVLHSHDTIVVLVVLQSRHDSGSSSFTQSRHDRGFSRFPFTCIIETVSMYFCVDRRTCQHPGATIWLLARVQHSTSPDRVRTQASAVSSDISRAKSVSRDAPVVNRQILKFK